MRRMTLLVLVLTVLCLSSAQAALIERLMGLAPDGVTPAPNLEVHLFFAVCQQRIVNNITRQEAIDILGLTSDEVVEFDAMESMFPSGVSALIEAKKTMFLEGVHSALILAEKRVSGYTTPALVRAKLGLP